MPSELMEMKRGLAAALRLTLTLFFLQGGWVMVLQLPAFPNGQCFVWEGTLGPD